MLRTLKAIIAITFVVVAPASQALETTRFHYYTHTEALDGLINYEGPIQFISADKVIDLTDPDEPTVCMIMVENVPESDPVLELPLVTEDGKEILFGSNWVAFQTFEELMKQTNCK